MHKAFSNSYLNTIIIGFFFFLINSCASSQSISPQTQLFSYSLDDIIIRVPYTCSDSEAFSWSKYWVSENFAQYSRTYEDSSIGLLSGYMNRQYNLAGFINLNYEITVSKGVATFKLYEIYSSTISFTTQSEHNNWAISSARGMANNYENFLKSK